MLFLGPNSAPNSGPIPPIEARTVSGVRLPPSANESPMSDIFSARSRVLAQCEERGGDCRKCSPDRSCPDFQLDLSLQRSLHSPCGRVCIVFEVDQVDILARSML